MTRAHCCKMIEIIGEDSIVHHDEVGLFELMTALETPDVQKEIVKGQVTDQMICQVHPYLIPLRRIRWRMQKERQEQQKREADRRKEYELRDRLREGLDHMYLHNLGGTPDKTYTRIKSEPLDDWAINQLLWQSTPPPQYDIEGAVATPCDCNVCTRGFNHYGFKAMNYEVE